MVGGGNMHGCWGVHGCRGACMVARGSVLLQWACVVAGGCGWLWGHVCGCRGACMVAAGHAWRRGGHAWWQGAGVGYEEIRSMSGRYASYWNAFLFKDTDQDGTADYFESSYSNFEVRADLDGDGATDFFDGDRDGDSNNNVYGN